MKKLRIQLETAIDDSVLKYLYFQLERSPASRFSFFGNGLIRLLEMAKRLKPSVPVDVYCNNLESQIIYSFLGRQSLDPYLADLKADVPDIEAFKGSPSKLTAALILANRYRIIKAKGVYYYDQLAEDFRSLDMVGEYEKYVLALANSIGSKFTYRGNVDIKLVETTLRESADFTFVNTDTKNLNADTVMAALVDAKGEAYACLYRNPSLAKELDVPKGLRVVYGKTIGSRTSPEYYLVTNLTSPQTQIRRIGRGLETVDVELYADQEINKYSQISFAELTRDQALYYRDLWVHKLHSVSAERNFLMLIDGRAFTVFGLQFKAAVTGTELNENYVHEIYGISCASKRWQTLNRLYMDLLTSFEFKNWVISVEPSLSFLGLKAVKTACISRLPEVRLNRGPLKIISRRMMPNGLLVPGVPDRLPI